MYGEKLKDLNHLQLHITDSRATCESSEPGVVKPVTKTYNNLHQNTSRPPAQQKGHELRKVKYNWLSQLLVYRCGSSSNGKQSI